MVINFSDLLSKKNRKKEISLSFELEPFEFEGEEIRAIENVNVEGLGISEKDVILIEASVKTKLKLNCSRCLDTFIYPIDIDIEERFTNNPDLEDEGIMFVDGDTINITEVIENCIISTLPIKRLCKEDCKGLCPECGVNKNVENCNCIDYDVDIRLAGGVIMGNPARKTYRAKRDSRRAQTFKLSLPGIVECPQCHEMKMAHRVCKNCGFYKGKEVVASTEE